MNTVSLNNVQKSNYYQPKFTGLANVTPKAKSSFFNLSNKSLKLMAALDTYIDKTWKGIKDGKINQLEPFFARSDKGNILTIKPIYTQRYPAVLFEHDDGKCIQKILFNRERPVSYRYEKTVSTDHGSATLKSYVSNEDKTTPVDNYVDDIICSNLPQIIPNKILLEHFPKSAFKPTSGGKLQLN